MAPYAVPCRVREQAILGRPARQTRAENGTVGQDNLLQKLEVVLAGCVTANITKNTQFSNRCNEPEDDSDDPEAAMNSPT